MLVVIDTNIFISYLLVPASQPAKIVALWQSGKFDVLTAQPQIDELMRVTRYPKIKERISTVLAGRFIKGAFPKYDTLETQYSYGLRVF